MTETIIVALAAAVPATLAAIVGVINAFRIQSVHVLVNSNYSDQVAKLAAVEAKLAGVERALAGSKAEVTALEAATPPAHT